ETRSVSLVPFRRPTASVLRDPTGFWQRRGPLTASPVGPSPEGPVGSGSSANRQCREAWDLGETPSRPAGAAPLARVPLTAGRRARPAAPLEDVRRDSPQVGRPRSYPQGVGRMPFPRPPQTAARSERPSPRPGRLPGQRPLGMLLAARPL